MACSGSYRFFILSPPRNSQSCRLGLGFVVSSPRLVLFLHSLSPVAHSLHVQVPYDLTCLVETSDALVTLERYPMDISMRRRVFSTTPRCSDSRICIVYKYMSLFFRSVHVCRFVYLPSPPQSCRFFPVVHRLFTSLRPYSFCTPSCVLNENCQLCQLTCAC